MASSTFTANEVAALSGVEEKSVRKEVEYGVFERPSFSFEDLVYFSVLGLVTVRLGVADRRKLHAAIVAAMAARRRPDRVELGPFLEVRLDRATEEAGNKLARFEAWKRKLVKDDKILGGEPVFPRSRLAVRQIGGMLLRGAKPEEIREDYPSLKDEDLEFAPVFTRAYPRMGRPRERQAAAR